MTGIVELQHAAQERFGALPLDRFRCWRRRRFEPSLPMGNEALAVAGALLLRFPPAWLAQIRPFHAVSHVGKDRVIGLPVQKALAAALAGMRSQLDVPIIHAS